MSKKSAKRSKSFNFSRPAVAFLIGPTASGKTALIRELARRLPIEVIGCDSMQVYRELRVLSQAPTLGFRRIVKHHEVGIKSVSQECSAAEFVARAKRLIPQIADRGRLPVVAGGTGLYAHALADGLFEGPKPDWTVRKALYARVEREGSPALHRELSRKDPEAAAVMHPNDARRVVRALEAIEVSGEKFSDLKRRRRGIAEIWSVRFWGLRWDRSELYRRIDARVNAMMRSGARAEAERLNKRRLSRTASGCLGLREIGSWIRGQATREAALSELQMNTRRYAKRQISWWARDPRVHWIDRSSSENESRVAERLEAEIRSWLAAESLLAQPSTGAL